MNDDGWVDESVIDERPIIRAPRVADRRSLAAKRVVGVALASCLLTISVGYLNHTRSAVPSHRTVAVRTQQSATSQTTSAAVPTTVPTPGGELTSTTATLTKPLRPTTPLTSAVYVQPTPTSAHQALVLTRVRVGVGAPCHDSTTTTGNDGSFEIDGCWFFVDYPTGQGGIQVRVASDHGYSLPTAPSCQSDACSSYEGPIKGDREVGERECFWLTTSDPSWTRESNAVCISWPQRQH